ncbi:acyltransferase family protein [Oceanicaulis sp. LC35]|uniref:acyltransferase family protein n=1 Tax=Oceanicaulis sp. LC35 TaxID=3349635 RepID=UPI003F8561AF
MTETGPRAMAAPTRRHDLDWLRIIAFGLLVLYHVGMFYVPWGWHVKSVHAGSGAEPLMSLLNPWRLALLFFISGVAFRYLYDKSGGWKFAGERTWRLLPVIVFGMLVVVMPQTYFQLREMGEIEPGILAFWPHYITDWEIAGIAVPTWNHLWYVVYLFVYALVLAPLMGLLKAFGRGPGAVLGRIWDSRFGPLLIIGLGFAPMMVYRVFLTPHFDVTHNLVWDWANHAYSFTCVLYGFFAAKSERFWRGVDRALPLALGLTVVLGVVLTPVWALYWDQVAEHAVPLWLARAGRVLYAWSMIVTLLGLARRFLNTDGPVRRYLTEAIFPVYILHQTITVAAGYALTRMGLDVWTEFVLLTLITYAGSFAGFEIIRRIKPLRPLFGLKL